MPTKTAAPATATSGSKPRAAERILATARELFYREGIRAVGVDEIVSRAGVTKPSLYRSFASKDELAAQYLRDYEKGFWQRFEASHGDHPDDPRAQLVAYLGWLAARIRQPGYRGCGLTNAAVEYPDPAHPARRVAEANKRAVNARLRAMCEAMGAQEPQVLADGLQLLLEGAYAAGQMLGGEGPVRSLVATAERLIDASLR